VAGLSVRLVTARRWELREGIVKSVSEGPRMVTGDSRTARRAGWEEILETFCRIAVGRLWAVCGIDYRIYDPEGGGYGCGYEPTSHGHLTWWLF